MTPDPHACRYPRCRSRSVVTLIDAPLCINHWTARCELEHGPEEDAFLEKIGLRYDVERGTVKA